MKSSYNVIQISSVKDELENFLASGLQADIYYAVKKYLYRLERHDLHINDPILGVIEKSAYKAAYDHYRGNKSKASKILDVSYSTYLNKTKFIA